MLLLQVTLHSESVQTIEDVQPTVNTVHLTHGLYPISAILSQAFAADDEAWSRERSDVTAERGDGLEEGRP
jgi:hypothetical protein